MQERLTKQVADWLEEQLAPKGVGVVIEAEHLCMSLRGVQAHGSSTVTSALHGLLRSDQRSRGELFALAGGEGMTASRVEPARREGSSTTTRARAPGRSPDHIWRRDGGGIGHTTSERMISPTTTVCTLWTMMPIQVLR